MNEDTATTDTDNFSWGGYLKYVTPDPVAWAYPTYTVQMPTLPSNPMPMPNPYWQQIKAQEFETQQPMAQQSLLQQLNKGWWDREAIENNPNNVKGRVLSLESQVTTLAKENANLRAALAGLQIQLNRYKAGKAATKDLL